MCLVNRIYLVNFNIIYIYYIYYILLRLYIWFKLDTVILIMWKPVSEAKGEKERKKHVMIRQWLCCVVLRNVGLWPIFVAIIRTYPYNKTVKTRIQQQQKWRINNETRVTHTYTHPHTYIYIRVYICRLCHFFQSRESDPSENREGSIVIGEVQNIESKFVSVGCKEKG